MGGALFAWLVFLLVVVIVYASGGCLLGWGLVFFVCVSFGGVLLGGGLGVVCLGVGSVLSVFVHCSYSRKLWGLFVFGAFCRGVRFCGCAVWAWSFLSVFCHWLMYFGVLSRSRAVLGWLGFFVLLVLFAA